MLETGHWRGLAYRSAGLQSHLQGSVLETGSGDSRVQWLETICGSRTPCRKAISRAWCWRRWRRSCFWGYPGHCFPAATKPSPRLDVGDWVKNFSRTAVKPSPGLGAGDSDPSATTGDLANRGIGDNAPTVLQSHLQGLVLETLPVLETCR